MTETALPQVPLSQQRRDPTPLPAARPGTAPLIPAGQGARKVPEVWPQSRISAEAVLARGMGVFPANAVMRRSGIRTLLAWLESLPGESWQQRWLASGADGAQRDWVDLVARGTGRRGGGTANPAMLRIALRALLGADAVRPSMAWITDEEIHFALPALLDARDPTARERLDAAYLAHGGSGGNLVKARNAVTRIMLCKGGTLNEITVGDCVEYWEARRVGAETE